MEINKIICGDSLTVLKTLDRESVDCCITSPPYWGLRDYGTAKWEGGREDCDHRIDRANRTITEKTKIDVSESMSLSGEFVANGDICSKCGAKRIDAQLGLEKTPEEYVAKMVEVFGEVKRVLKKEGVMFLNLGDSYWGGGFGTSPGGNEDFAERYPKQASNRGTQDHETRKKLGALKKHHAILKPKDLVGIPWHIAFALQIDGWYLRQDIIWAKPNPMPESVTDRCTKSHEYIFLMSKSPKYYFDQKAISEPAKQCSIARLQRAVSNENKWINEPDGQTKHTMNQPRENYKHLKGKAPERFGGADHLVAPWEGNVNKRSVWTVTTKPFKEAHFATFPEDLIVPMVLAGTKKGGIILDPFIGAGTTAVVAKKNGRNYIGIELNPKYVDMAEKRIGAITKPLL